MRSLADALQGLKGSLPILPARCQSQGRCTSTQALTHARSGAVSRFFLLFICYCRKSCKEKDMALSAEGDQALHSQTPPFLATCPTPALRRGDPLPIPPHPLQRRCAGLSGTGLPFVAVRWEVLKSWGAVPAPLKTCPGERVAGRLAHKGPSCPHTCGEVGC